MDYRISSLQQEIEALKSGGGPELEKELEKTKHERDEGLQRLEASDKELNEARVDLSKVQRLLKEAWVRARKMDDELLQSVKALESARAELPRQAIDDYKESAGFKEGLKRMGRVTYEYGYRVALTRFRSLHRTRRSRRIPSPSDPRMTWCQWRGNKPLMTRTHPSHNL
ncbi:hypothetical protein BHM03_00062081 [Ensete ventricosum]|nr:hypothetical protein BHM03_00062081 [Ensete ventricosum]